MMSHNILPSVNEILGDAGMIKLVEKFSRDFVKKHICSALEKYRAEALSASLEDIQEENAEKVTESRRKIVEKICSEVSAELSKVADATLKSVINGSGIILHTNLGRTPFSDDLLKESFEKLRGYSNLEFNLETGERGNRNNHLNKIISYLTGAEDSVAVNNNAAAVFLILNALGKDKETIVSRGELVEIGGSFRVPDIMASSGTKMVEVGTTNKTKVSDYEKAISESTSLLLKTHRSNFCIKGFTEEVSIKELADIAEKHGLISVYDIGSGLLRRVENCGMESEPIVQEAIADGIDVVCFSGDKLLGGGQAGIIAGKSEYISKIKKHPLMRALRVGKETVAILQTACSYYLNDKDLFNKNLLFKTLARPNGTLHSLAVQLADAVKNAMAGNVDDKEFSEGIWVSESEGQYGGGTMPDKTIRSWSVIFPLMPTEKNAGAGEKLYHALLSQQRPVLSNLIKGKIQIDVLCIDENEIDFVAQSVVNAYKSCSIL